MPIIPLSFVRRTLLEERAGERYKNENAPDGQGRFLTNYKPIYEKDILSEQSHQLSILP